MTPDAGSPGIQLCAVSDIPEPGARSFEVATTAGPLDVVIVRAAGDVHGYVNSCPHQGTPLETFADRFMTMDCTALLCSTHGAQFRLADGLCIRGPCKGARLRRAGTHVLDGHIYLHDGPPAKVPHTKV